MESEGASLLLLNSVACLVKVCSRQTINQSIRTYSSFKEADFAFGFGRQWCQSQLIHRKIFDKCMNLVWTNMACKQFILFRKCLIKQSFLQVWLIFSWYNNKQPKNWLFWISMYLTNYLQFLNTCWFLTYQLVNLPSVWWIMLFGHVSSTADHGMT